MILSVHNSYHPSRGRTIRKSLQTGKFHDVSTRSEATNEKMGHKYQPMSTTNHRPRKCQQTSVV